MPMAAGSISSYARAASGCGPSASPALDGKLAQMEFAKVGDRDSASGDVLTLSSARDKAREYKVALRRDGVDPRLKKRATSAATNQPAPPARPGRSTIDRGFGCDDVQKASSG